MKTETAIGYVRVSTGAQAEFGVSLDAQESRIRQWCEANSRRLLTIYRDEGLSGKRADNRPNLQRALSRACNMRGALVVYSLSRLARSIPDAVDISQRLGKASADLVVLTQPIDTTTPSGRLYFHLIAAFDQFTREQIAENTREALAYKRSRGERVGNVPYGFTLASDGVTLEPNPTEQPAVDLIVALRQGGQTLEQIREALRERGIPNRRGNLTWRLNTISDVAKRAANGQ
jgi:site-specific DNA recombinase